MNTISNKVAPIVQGTVAIASAVAAVYHPQDWVINIFEGVVTEYGLPLRFGNRKLSCQGTQNPQLLDC